MSGPRAVSLFERAATAIAHIGRLRFSPVTRVTTAKVVYRAYQPGGVFFYVGLRANVLELTPALTRSDSEAHEGLELIDQAITDVTRGLVSDADVAPFMMWRMTCGAGY